MTKESRTYLFKTMVAFVLMIGGGWGIYTYAGFTKALAAICFLIGFIIMLALYGWKWLEVLLDAWFRW